MGIAKSTKNIRNLIIDFFVKIAISLHKQQEQVPSHLALSEDQQFLFISAK